MRRDGTINMRYSTLERAFQLAQHGPSISLNEVRATLVAEGYGDAVMQTSFPALRKQLRDAIQKRLACAPADIEDQPRLKGVLHLAV